MITQVRILVTASFFFKFIFRLAKKYIAEIESENVEEALIDDIKEEKGKLFKENAEMVMKLIKNKKYLLKLMKNGHSRAVTVVRPSLDSKFIYSGGKDGTFIKWAW